ncbi:MAG: efflux RND transporter periplasmic adaptor subunit [Candidatus Acidiferrum sp.]
MNKMRMTGELMLRRNWIVGIGLALVVSGCGGNNPVPAQKVESVQGIRTQKIEMQPIPDEIEAPGSVIAVNTAQVAARTIGTAIQVAVREGDRVRRGQLLAQLDERELAARRSSAEAAEQASTARVDQATKAVAAAQAQADVAKKTYDRYVYLKNQKSVSPQEFDEVEAKYQAAQAGLEQATAGLHEAAAGADQAKSEAQAASSVASYARVVAPFDGRVVRRQVEPGSLVSPGVPLFIVEDTSRYQLEVTLPTDVLAKVRKGSTARVQLDALTGKSIVGKVAEIEAGADPMSHTARARIDLAEELGVQSGLFGRAFFRQGEARALLVPIDAVVLRGQLSGLYVADSSGVARWRVVTLGKSRGEAWEVLSGLNEGDSVALNPGTRELDGKRISGSTAQAGEKRP